MKKVLMVGPVPPPFGGIAAVVEDIISSELNRDYQFKVFNKAEIPVSGFVRRVLFRVERLWAFMKEIRSFRPDFMHIHSADPAFMGTMIFIIIAKLFGLKILAHLHGTDWDDFYTEQSSIKREGIKLGLRIPDKVVVLYEKWAEKIRELSCAIDVHIIRNLIHLPKKEDPDVLIKMRESLDILNKKVILTIGSVGFRKGSFDIIKAVPMVLEQISDIVFVIVGGGENPGEFEKAYSMVQDENVMKSCKLVGEVERAQVPRYLQITDVFLLPSYVEGMPISIIEAMSQAVPIISTPVGGIPELIHDEVNGILISPGNPNEIAHSVIRLVKDPDLCKKFGSSGYDHFMSNYEFSKGIHEIHAIYEQMLR